MKQPIQSNVKPTEVNFSLHYPLVRRVMCGFIRNELHRAGFKKAVLGLSGGIDSTVVCYLAAEALGPENVWAVMMPYKTSSEATRDHSRLVVERLGVPHAEIPITQQIDAYFAQFPEASQLRRANKCARERMTVLYDQSAAVGGLVLGTSNKSELLLGYGTQFGDMASALNPVGDLYKTQLRELAVELNVPAEILAKPPSGDLWVGQTDEDELGFRYADVDRLLYLLVDRRHTPAEVLSFGFSAPFVQRVTRLVQLNHYKRRLPVICKLSHRTPDRDFRYARDWGT